jgi:hypothetical protein
MPSTSASRSRVAALLLVAAPVALAACGGSKSRSGSGTPADVSFSIAEQSGTARFTVPKSVRGGLVKLSLKNAGKKPHSAQLLRLTGGHSAQDALKIIAGSTTKTPAWLRGAGGLGGVAPGTTQSAVLNLQPGRYAVADVGQQGGAPAFAEFTVSKGKSGHLPETSVTIDGASTGKNAYAWNVSGQLRPGADDITFVSGGTDTLHFVGAFRITGTHSDAEIVKALSSNGKPPAFVDQKSFYDTAVLDSGKSQTTTLALRKPGTYVLFCPLADRRGGKPHFLEGMLKQVTVK